MRFAILLQIGLLFACAQFSTAWTPPSGLNRFCGAHIYNPAQYTECVYMLQSGYASTVSTDQNTVVIAIYKTPALLSFANTTLDIISPQSAAYQDLDGTSVNNWYNPSLHPDVFPARLVFLIPSCANLAYSWVESSDNLQVEEWNSDGTARVTVSVPATPTQCRGTISFAKFPVCAARSTQIFDTNCATDAIATSFASCAANQTLISPIPLPQTQSSVGNATSSIPPAVYENLARNSYVLDSRCATFGTNLWQQSYNSAFFSSRGFGIAPKDIGAPSGYDGTATLEIDPACNSAVTEKFYIKLTGMYNASLSAAPVWIQTSALTPDASRVAYAPSVSCENVVPRPPGAVPLSPIVTVQPYCRQSYYAANSGGFYGFDVINSMGLYFPVANPANNLIWAVYASNLPPNDIQVWTRVKLVTPTDDSQTEYFGPYLLQNGYTTYFYSARDANTNPGSRLVYIQRYSDQDPWELAAVEAQVSTVPYCNCWSAPDTFARAGLVPCDNTTKALIANTPVQNNLWAAAAPVVNGVLPACTIKLTNGFLGSPSAVLENGTYNAALTYEGANSFQWFANSSAPGAFTFLTSTTANNVDFDVSSKVSNLKLVAIVTNTSTVPPYSTSCSLNLQVFEGLPKVYLYAYPSSVHVGSPSVVLNSSESYSTTDESITWSWSVVYPDPSTLPNNILFTTGNVSINYFVPDQIGMFIVQTTVSNGRVSASKNVEIFVSESVTPGNNTNQPSNCIANITNGNVTQPNLPPYDGTQFYVPAPPQVDPILFTPEQAAGPGSGSLGPSSQSPSTTNNPAVGGNLALILGGILLGLFGVSILAVFLSVLVNYVKIARTRANHPKAN